MELDKDISPAISFGDRLDSLLMRNSRVSVDEKLKDNRCHREAMLAAIASGEAICFVGAGLSVSLKYPSWPDLLAKLQDRANQIAPFNPSALTRAKALEYADEICKHFETHNAAGEFLAILGREFSPRKNGSNCTATHRRVVKLPFRTIVTTNYDSCLECALSEKAFEETKPPPSDPSVIIKKNSRDPHRVSLFLRSIAETDGKDIQHIAHLHGRHDETETIILTNSDYLESYGITSDGKQPKNATVTLHRLLVWSLFATRRIIFFGSSMDDPYVVALLNMVANDLGEHGEPTHFVVLPITEQSVLSTEGMSQKFLRFGLQPVFFDNERGDFSQLDQLLDEAIECCRPRRRRDTDSMVSSGQSSARDGKSATPGKTFTQKLVSAILDRLARLFGQKPFMQQQTQSEVIQNQPVNQDWLEEINQNTTKGLKENED